MFIKNLYLVLLIGLLSSCGYHLTGAIKLPEGVNSIYLDGASPELKTRFKKSFGTDEGKVTDNIENAGIIIRIYNEVSQRRILSLSAGGAANSFELDYDFNYDVFDAHNKALSQNQLVSIKREYFNNQQTVIAKDNEELVIRSEMYRQAVGSLLNGVKIALEPSKK